MPSPLDAKTLSIIKACVPALEAHGLDITQEMYKRLLSNPDIRDLFNMSHQKDGEQPKALALAVLAYARNIDNLGALGSMVERIAEKHVGLNILPKHYPYVADALLGAIAHVLGDAATPEILEAWGKAYWFLADILMGREKQIYEEHAAAPGGWVGWRPFTVRRKVRESHTITSFELVSVDNKPIMKHEAGQYLSFKLDVPKHGSQRRNYSISSEPGADHYRISVRRADGGVVSQWLHDTVQEGQVLDVSAPAGDFTPGTEQNSKIVLLCAGVGQTPFISTLGAFLKDGTKRNIHYIHGVHTAQDEAFTDYIYTLAEKDALEADIFYSHSPVPTNRSNKNVKLHEGRITAGWLKPRVDITTDYNICGPDSFMRDMIKVLTEAGVPENQIHYEFFGSAADAELVGV